MRAKVIETVHGDIDVTIALIGRSYVFLRYEPDNQEWIVDEEDGPALFTKDLTEAAEFAASFYSESSLVRARKLARRLAAAR